MKVYITSFQLLNFQSWDNQTHKIDIASDIVNIIEGANETGKSVLYKVMYNMCFPGYWDAKELIRRGYQTACLFFELSDSSAVAYELSLNHHAYYLSIDGNMQKWSDCPIPDALVERLGLILDYDAHVILNVIDKDVPLPFIKTTPKFNASLIRAVVEPAKISDFFARTGEHLKEVDAARAEFRTRMNAAQEAVSVLDYKDVDTLRLSKRRVDRLISVTERFAALQAAIADVLDVEGARPVEVDEPKQAEQMIRTWDLAVSCSRCLNLLVDLKGQHPQEVTNPQNAQKLVIAYDKVTDLKRAILGYERVTAQSPNEVKTVPDEQLLKVLEALHLFSTIIDSCVDIIATRERHWQYMNSLAGEIQEIKDKVGVCPTCGRLL